MLLEDGGEGRVQPNPIGQNLILFSLETHFIFKYFDIFVITTVLVKKLFLQNLKSEGQLRKN